MHGYSILSNKSLSHAEIGMASSIITKNMVKLWENPDPTAEFGAQTINLDLSKYTMVCISYRLSTTTTQESVFYILMNTAFRAFVFSNISGSGYIDIRSRTATVSATGVQFGTATTKACNVADAGEVNNIYVIPIKIYGIKG